MRYSVSVVATDETATVTALAKAVESAGLDGLWLPDHTHIPVSRRSSYPGGGGLPERYKRTVDPLVALSAAAAVTTTLRVGTGILLAGVRDPIVTAKALATLDRQSGGRLRVGVGYGWNLEELADHGVDADSRFGRTREHVQAMRALWSQDEASYVGRFVSFDACWSWPKPLQQPLPVYLGAGATDRAFDQVALFADGWIPVGGSKLADGVRRLRSRVAAAGRDPMSLEVVPFSSADTSHEKLDAFERAGATEVAFELALTQGSGDPFDRIGVLGQLVSDHREGAGAWTSH